MARATAAEAVKIVFNCMVTVLSIQMSKVTTNQVPVKHLCSSLPHQNRSQGNERLISLHYRKDKAVENLKISE
jgi:hypothetical protein